ncbi:MAG TPA: DNA (cytosine-5-)-methyltransferase [Usitatibacter sp.]|nr:DNA (cytosine-5-)-methyltransferase [Usitatibacter sp.]
MKVAGLFAGIGGFESGFHAAGHETSLLCEIKPEAVRVLQEQFPGVPIDRDIRKLKAIPRDIDVVCGGFPCQDLSQAGKTSGLEGDNSGLIYEVLRLLNRRPRVPWVVLENVPFMLQLNGGYAMREILDSLESLGYRWAYRVVDSFSFGLPQRRERVFIVASIDGHPEEALLADDSPLERPTTDLRRLAHGFYWTEGTSGLGWAVDSVPTLKNGSTIGIPSPPAVLMPNGAIVKPDIRDAERLQGFEADWTISAEEVARSSMRWSLVGSAVSVPVAKWIGIRLSKPGRFDLARCFDFPRFGKLPKACIGDKRGRYGVDISVDPVGMMPEHLKGFLRFPGMPLSLKATEGFYGRAQKARLRFADGFLEAVQRHLAVISAADQHQLALA